MADICGTTRGRRPVQMVVKNSGWTKRAREMFLATLAETCNVRLAVAAAGLSQRGAYRLRDRDPAFAALWQQALEIGYDRLETAVLRRALIGINAIDLHDLPEVARDLAPERGDGKREPTTMDMQMALAVLARHRATVEKTRAPTRRRRRLTQEEVDALLTRKLDALAKKLGNDL